MSVLHEHVRRSRFHGRDGPTKDGDGRYVGELERGFHSPTLTMAKRIADALEVSLAELVKEVCLA